MVLIGFLQESDQAGFSALVHPADGMHASVHSGDEKIAGAPLGLPHRPSRYVWLVPGRAVPPCTHGPEHGVLRESKRRAILSLDFRSNVGHFSQ